MKRRVLCVVLSLALCFAMLPAGVLATESDTETIPENYTTENTGAPESGITSDGTKPKDGPVESADERQQEPVESAASSETDAGGDTESGSAETEDGLESEEDTLTEDNTQDEAGEASGRLPAMALATEDETSYDESATAPVSIQPEIANADAAMGYLSQFKGVYRINRDIPAKNWSIEITDADIRLLNNGEDTGAVVTAIAWNGSAVTSLTFSNVGQWFDSKGTTNQTLVFTWNNAGYFTMPGTTIYGSDKQPIQAFTSGAIMYNETGLKNYFNTYAGKYPLNDGSGWYVEISGEGMVSLHDGSSDSATEKAFISSVTFNTTNHSVVSTVVFMSPDWYNTAGTANNQTLTLTWGTAATVNTMSGVNFARNEFTVNSTTLYNSDKQVLKYFTQYANNNLRTFVGTSWANDYFTGEVETTQVDYTGIYPAGVGNAVTGDWKLEIDSDGYVWLYMGETKGPAQARLFTVASTARTATGSTQIPRVATMVVSVPGYYGNTNKTLPAILTLTWTADNTAGAAYQGNGIGRFTTAAATFYNEAGEAVTIPALYFDHDTMYTGKAKTVLKDYTGTYTLDDGSGWYVKINTDGSAMLYDGEDTAYEPYYYSLTNPLSESPSLSSIIFRDAGWYNNTGATGYQTLTLVWSSTISSTSTYKRLAFVSNASNGAALTTVLYNKDATVKKNFNGTRFTYTSWGNEYFTGTNTDAVVYTGIYDVGAGYGGQYPQVKDWKLEIDESGYVWLYRGSTKLNSAPATFTAAASTTRTAAGASIPRVSTMLIAIPGYYATNAATKPQGYMTLTWQADNTSGASWQGNGIYRFTSNAVTLYNDDGEAVYFPAMYFDHNEKYTAVAKDIIKLHSGTYKINDGSGWSVTVAADGSVTLIDNNGEEHVPYYYSVTNLLSTREDGMDGSTSRARSLASITFGDKDWFTNSGTAPQNLTMNWTPATQRFAPSGSVALYNNAKEVLRYFATTNIFSKNENLDKAKNYLKEFAGEYLFNDGSGSAVRINGDGSISIKLTGITAGDGFIDVDYTPAFTNYNYSGNQGGDYVSSVQIPIPGRYANTSVNAQAYLTLTWNGNAASIVNHCFTNGSTAFYETASEYKVLSAGCFYSVDDMSKAAEYLKKYAGEYHPRVSDAWYAEIDANGYVTIHTRDAEGAPLDITPALNIKTVDAAGAVTNVDQVFAVLPAYAGSRTNQDVTNVNYAPQITFSFTPNTNSPYFSAGNTTLYDRLKADGSPWGVVAGTDENYYKTFSGKLYGVDRAYSDANKAAAREYFKDFAGTYVIDDGLNAYKITISVGGDIYWSDYTVVGIDNLLPADVNFNSVLNDKAVPSSVYMWYNGYYNAATASTRGSYNVYTFTQRGDLAWNTTGTNASQLAVRYSFTSGGNNTSANGLFQEDGSQITTVPSTAYHYFPTNAEPDYETFVDGRYYANDNSGHYIDIATNGEGRTYLYDGMYPLILFGRDDDHAFLRGVLGTTTAAGTTPAFGVFNRVDNEEISVSGQTTYYSGGVQAIIREGTSYVQNDSDEDGTIVVVNPGETFESGRHYHYLAQAVYNVENGGIIYLTKDISIRVAAGALGNKQFTVDGSTHYEGEGEVAVISRGEIGGAPYTGTFLKIGENSDVVLKDVIIDAGGDWEFDTDKLDEDIKLSLNNTTIPADQYPVKVNESNNVNATGNLIELTNGKLTVENSEITNFYTTSGSCHVFDFGSGLYGGELILNNSRLCHNAGTNHLFAHNTGKTTIILNEGTKVSENYTSGGNGGLFYMANASVLYINEGVSITENVAMNSRGTIADAIGRVKLAEEDRGSVEKERIYTESGVDYECSYVYINGASITENIGLNGGGQPFYNEGYAGLTLDGGGRIVDNIGSYCGAIWSIDVVTLDIVIKDGEISGNKVREGGYESIFCMGTVFYEGAKFIGNVYMNDGRLILYGTVDGDVWIDGNWGGLTIEESGVVYGDIHVVWGYMGQNRTGDDFFTNNGTLYGSIIVEDHTYAENNGFMEGDVTVNSRSASSGTPAFVNGADGELQGGITIADGTSAANEGSIQGDITIQSNGSYTGNNSFDNREGGVVNGNVEVGPNAVASNEGFIKGDVNVKADGEFIITGNAEVEGDVTIMPGGELRANNSAGNLGTPHVNGKIILEYEDEEDLRRMKEILEDSGITYESIEEVKHTHTTTQPTEVAPTCTEDGVSYNECETCGRRYGEMALPALGHDWVEKVLQEQDCTHDKLIVMHCGRECGIDDIFVASKALATGHNFVMVDSTQVTGAIEGYLYFKCQNHDCSQVKSVELPVFDATRHRPEADTHTWDSGAFDVEPNCIQEGRMTYTCIECGAQIRITVSVTGHKPDNEPVVVPGKEKAATCTTDGYTEKIQHCTVCNGEIEGTRERELFLATGHNWGDWIYETENHICTDGGKRTHKCLNIDCGESETQLYRAAAHTWNEEGTVCIVCRFGSGVIDCGCVNGACSCTDSCECTICCCNECPGEGGSSTNPGGNPGNPADPGGSPDNPTNPGGNQGNPTNPGGNQNNSTNPGGNPGNPADPGGSSGNSTNSGDTPGSPADPGGSFGDSGDPESNPSNSADPDDSFGDSTTPSDDSGSNPDLGAASPNVGPDNQQDNTLPSGGNSNGILWFILFGLSGLGMLWFLLFLLFKRREKSEDDESQE